MEVAVLLLLPLVGGYIFARTCNFTRFKSFREEGHRLYFRAVFYGVFLLAVCLLVRLYLFAAWPSYGEIETDIAPFLSFVGKEPSKGNPVPIAIAGAASMLLAYPLGKFLNLFLWKWVYVEQAAHTDDFERILHEAVLRTIPICATMENRKVYVGFVRKTFEATQERRSLAIIPLTSGYRSETDSRLTFTTDYQDIYGSADPTKPYEHLPPPLANLSVKDFEIALPVDKIHSLSLFDLRAYAEFQKKQEERAKTTPKPNASLDASG